MRPRTPRATGNAALVGAVLAWLAACSPPAPPRDHILFDHGPHLSRGAGCSDCHAGATGSSTLVEGLRDDLEAAARETAAEETRTDAATEPSAPPSGGSSTADWTRIPHPGAGARPLLPTEAQCRTCHDDSERDRCAYCHTQPSSPGPYDAAERDIVFDHARHAAPGAGQCITCHAGDARTAATFAPSGPTMESCTSSCHQDDMRELRCSICHTDLHRFRIDDVSILDHGPGFLRRHGVSARADSALCTQCHDPTFCEDCHLSAPGMPMEVIEPTAVYRDFVHRGDFLSRHFVEADLERGTCARCHGTPFCDGCHQASGVGGGVAPGSPHPPGWLDPTSAFGHARAARRDLLSCVSCHEADAETTCVPCHRVGGVAGNPHPPGFGSGLDPLTHGVCRACHVTP